MQYIGYFVLPPKKANQTRFMFQDQAILHHRKILETYAHNHPGQLLNVFMEVGDKKRQRIRWPQLEKAIESCLENQAVLLISNLGSLPTNIMFTDLISDFIKKEGHLICCDQIFVSAHNFSDIVEHIRAQRKNHGELIKAGLSRTTAKSGNPRAAELITRVNRPKIDGAIVFSLLLQPIIAHYREQGYSQRKMVQELNAAGYSAPEGGKWVLSQFQKVLERITLNEQALALQKTPENLSDKMQARLKEIKEILAFNATVLTLEPILKNISPTDITGDFLEEYTAQINQLNPNPVDHWDDLATRIRGALQTPKTIKPLLPFLETSSLLEVQKELLRQMLCLARLSSVPNFDRMLTL